MLSGLTAPPLLHTVPPLTRRQPLPQHFLRQHTWLLSTGGSTALDLLPHGTGHVPCSIGSSFALFYALCHCLARPLQDLCLSQLYKMGLRPGARGCRGKGAVPAESWESLGC
jgi:hypothetical protein